LRSKTIGKAGGKDARNSRAESVGRNRDAELPGRNVERGHQDGAERRHDDEIENDSELRERKQRNQE
jgi:hypothetical protein